MISFLVVDDDYDITEYIQNVLVNNYHDCHVDICHNGQDAAALCRQNIYDLVMTDLNMPLISGNELIAQLRQRINNYKKTPIIVISGCFDSQGQSLPTQNTFFIQKPFFSNKLITTTNLALLP